MTTSTPTNEGVAIAATVIAQAKGDVPSARRVLGDAHRWTCTIDPSFKADDKDARIAELETQVQASGEDREWDAMRADRDDFQAKVAKLTIENANLLRSVDDLTRRVVKIEVERDQAVAAVETEGELVGDLRRELAAVKLELAQVRALNFDAPRKADAEAERQAAYDAAAAGDGVHFDVEPTEAEKAASYATNPPADLHAAAPTPVQVAKPAQVSSDPVRPSNVSEGAWASMSPMMRSFAAKRAATVN